MHALQRTRSQHFASSPRRSATPLKHKVIRHVSKRRRVGSSALAQRAVNVEDTETEVDDAMPLTGPTRRGSTVLSEEKGEQTVNTVKSKRRKERDREEDKADDVLRGMSDVFTSGDESSPRKRKRNDMIDEMSIGRDSSSWIEVDEDEEEPKYMADSDHQLLHAAPATALYRLRKAELVRLWKVAGMWTSEEDDDASMFSAEDEDGGGLGKKELVDGLLAARRNSVDQSGSPDSPLLSFRNSPKRKAALEASFEISRLRSATASVLARKNHPHSHSPASPSSDDIPMKQLDLDATPRAPPGTRSRIRLRPPDNGLLQSASRKLPGTARKVKKIDRVRGRSRSMGGDGERKARFGDEVKSPGKGLFHRPTRRFSTVSSAYTTTDTSTEEPVIDGRAPRRPRRSGNRVFTSAQRHLAAKCSRVTFHDSRPNGHEVIEFVDSSDEDDADPIRAKQLDPTPLAKRLRSKARSSFVKDIPSEVEADGEDDDDADGGDEQSQASPHRRTRSRDQLIDPDHSMRNGRILPTRGAKQKAIEAIETAESEEEDGMDVDEPVDVEDEVDGEETEDEIDRPRSGPLTRSQNRVSGEIPGNQRRGSRVSPSPSVEDTERSPSLTPISTDVANGEDDEADEAEIQAAEARMTRSGKAFGIWQSRRKRLRQEAMDDPDMDVDEDEEEDEEEDPSEDVDLSEATLSSLLRMLRDELVQMCESRGIEVGGTKPQLAKALLEWRDEQNMLDDRSATSSQATARPESPAPATQRTRTSRPKPKIIHGVASTIHVSGKTTPVLLRDHIHATDPATPPRSDESRPIGEAELNLDLSELGLEDSVIKQEQLVKLEKIGSGGFKDVFVGKLRGRKVAISEFRGHLSEMDIRELKLLAEFSHPNIVRFRGICIPVDNSQIPCMLVSELCENGDLFDYIRNVPCPPNKRVLGLMLDIARGLEYLHTRSPSIIHRDCKSSNILINRAGQAKVGDFGLARVKNSTRSMIRSLVGTVNWQAPELWSPSPRYDYKVDVFSAAMVYWEMLSGWVGDTKYPWEGFNEHYIYDAVGTKQRRPLVTGLKKHWGTEPVNLMERMWHQDPRERPTMTDVVNDLEVLFAECD